MHPQELKILQHGVWPDHQVSPLPGCELRSSNSGRYIPLIPQTGTRTEGTHSTRLLRLHDEVAFPPWAPHGGHVPLD